MKKLIILVFVCMSINANILYKSNFDKEIFLDINSSFYTIDLSTLYYYDGYVDFVEELNNDKDIFVFEFGNNEESKFTKVLYGAFKDHKDALIVVNNLPLRLKNNKPYISKMDKFQKLYKKFHKKNSIIMKPSIDGKTNMEVEKKIYNKKERIEFFDSIKYILETHPEIQEQVAVVAAAQNEKDEQNSLFLPTVDFSYTKGKVNSIEDSTETSAKTKFSSKDVTATWNVFNGFADQNHYKLIGYKYDSSIYNKQRIIDEFIYKFIKAYIELIKTKEICNLGNINLKKYNEYVNKTKLKQKYGMSSLSNSMSIFKKQIATQINYIETNEKQYLDALYEIQNYIEVGDNSEILMSQKDIDINIDNFKLNDLLIEAVELHPKALKANIEIYLAKQKLKKENKNFMPIVDFVAKRSETEDTYVDKEETVKETTIKVQTKINLFNGGKDYYAIKRKTNEYKQKQFAYQKVIRQIKYDVKTSFNSYKTLKEKSLLMVKSLANSKKSYMAAKYDFEFAKINEEGLINAMESFQDAQIKDIEFKYDVILAKYKILFSIGNVYNRLENKIKNRIKK